MYAERQSHVAGAVVWRRRGGGEVRVLPDGCMDLMWDGTRVVVAGPDTRAHLAGLDAEAVVTGLRLAPGAAPLVLGLPAHALRDQRVPLAEVWSGSAAAELAERLAAGPDPAPVLEEAAGARLRAAGGVPPQLVAVVRGLREGLRVADVAAAVGLGERQLHRRSLAAFGYAPKTLSRVLRLQAALALARGGLPYAATAADAGYADQAHLAREVRDLAGVPLGRLLGAQRPPPGTRRP